ncbi:MAG: PilZ domain-containing protein [Gammaproteobacteria bacterium]|nr:PilZ domain-containing protein [Gammaproteobacteria bacterium]
MPHSESERRQYQRIPFIAEVLMEKDGNQWSSILLDISLKGMLIDPPSDLAPEMGSLYIIELVLGEGATIHMEAEITHANDSHWGMRWENIDLEGLTHLRRLLELNMANPDEMHREMAELG